MYAPVANSDLDESLCLHEPTDPELQPERTHEEILQALSERLEQLEQKQKSANYELECLDALFESRRCPFEKELQTIQKNIEETRAELDAVIKAIEEAGKPPPPGTASFSFVDHVWFSVFGNCTVAANIGCMFQLPRGTSIGTMMDQVFLWWYIAELSAKFIYFRWTMFFGPLSFVWTSWLDSAIVLGGVLDQVLMPIFVAVTGIASSLIPQSFMQMLRCLRLCRVLRALRLMKAFWQSDMAWTESPPFEIFMSGVIAANALIMSLELDIEWHHWPWIENIFLVIYSFELACRIKKARWNFFFDPDTIIWNALDFVMVSGGIFEMWMLPVVEAIAEGLGISHHENDHKPKTMSLMSMLRIMRILRVLRIVRLLKTIKPLYRLLMGVIQSLKAMQWVIVLTLLMLYAGAIFWTSLVGKGLIYGGSPPPGEGLKNFGSVPRSLFSLFRLMNGDTDVASSITNTVTGQLLFAAFMVLSNWAILAILTSVVSDNMISASQKAVEEDQEVEKTKEDKKKSARLHTLFREIDKDKSGTISLKEWNRIFEDRGLANELCSATLLSEKDLRELFGYICAERDGDEGEDAGGVIVWEDFIDHLQIDCKTADQRSILKLMAQFQRLENKVAKFLPLSATVQSASELKQSSSQNLEIVRISNDLQKLMQLGQTRTSTFSRVPDAGSLKSDAGLGVVGAGTQLLESAEVHNMSSMSTTLAREFSWESTTDGQRAQDKPNNAVRSPDPPEWLSKPKHLARFSGDAVEKDNPTQSSRTRPQAHSDSDAISHERNSEFAKRQFPPPQAWWLAASVQHHEACASINRGKPPLATGPDDQQMYATGSGPQIDMSKDARLQRWGNLSGRKWDAKKLAAKESSSSARPVGLPVCAGGRSSEPLLATEAERRNAREASLPTRMLNRPATAPVSPEIGLDLDPHRLSNGAFSFLSPQQRERSSSAPAPAGV